MKWPKARLGDIADVQLGKMLSPKARQGNSPARYLRNTNVQWGHIDLTDLLTMDFDENDRGKFSLRRGDVLVCEGGEPGRCAVLDSDLDGIFFQKALMRVRTRPDTLEPRFLQRFMEHAGSRGLFARDGIQATIAHFPAVRLNALEIPLPPLPEQRRIADILDKADAIRRKRKQAIALTEELLRSTFLEMFGDPVTNPKGWEVKPLEHSFADPPRIGTLVPAGDGPGHLIVRVGEIGQYNVALDKCKRASLTDKELDRFGLLTGDVVLARAIGSEDHLGKASVLQPATEPIAFDSHVMRLRFNSQLMDPYFFVQWLRSQGGRARFMRQAGRTAVQFNVNGKQIGRVQIPLPPMPEQINFRRIFDGVRTMTGKLDNGHKEADALFRALTHSAFQENAKWLPPSE